MAKYPGFSILYEVGSRKELAQSYGVSERTIYRWLNKAAKESGIAPKVAVKFPGAKRIEAFKGTRKAMAAKYGVSERTIYRWLNKARSQGASVPSRANKSKYPGQQILYEVGTNKELAQSYGVSPRTISRWKRKAADQEEIDEINRGLPEEIVTEPEEEFINEEPQIETPEVDEILDSIPEPDTDGRDYTRNPFYDEWTPEMLEYLDDIIDVVSETEGLISEDSIFRKLSKEEQRDYINEYLQYQSGYDEHQFYNELTHQMDYSPNFISNINIWGEEFEDWAQQQHDYGMYEIPYF